MEVYNKMFNTVNGGYSLADIAAVTGNGGGRSGSNNDGWNDGGAWWIIILFLFVFCGWGNNGNNGSGSGGTTTREEISYGFDMNGLDTGIRAVQNGLCDGFYAQNTSMLTGFNGVQSDISAASAGLQNTLCQGFNGINTSLLSATSNLQQDLNAINIANMQSTNALQSQINDCCCKNDAAIAQVRYDMATDTCAINTNAANNARDIIDSQNAGTRAILDAIQQSKIDAMQDKIASLTAQNQGLQFAASQAAQNTYLVDALRPCPVPAYITPNPYCNCGGNAFAYSAIA